MADIFISYKKEDKRKAELLAGKLEKSGWKVWWDYDLMGGEDYDVEIELELSKAKCVIVIWSALSVQSRNVKDEAKKALNRNILIPVSFDNIEPPIGFGMTQVIIFESSNKINDGEYAKLCKSVEKKLNIVVPLPPQSDPPFLKIFFRKYGYYLLGVMLLLVAYYIYKATSSPTEIQSKSIDTIPSQEINDSPGTKKIDTPINPKIIPPNADTGNKSLVKKVTYTDYLEMMNAINDKNPEIVKEKLEMGVDPNKNDADNVSPLFRAVYTRKYEIVELLVNNKADLNSTNIRGVTALTEASYMGEYKIVKLLLDNNANPNIGNYPPLMSATNKEHKFTNDHKLIFCELLKHGADPDIKFSGSTVLDFVKAEWPDEVANVENMIRNCRN